MTIKGVYSIFIFMFLIGYNTCIFSVSYVILEILPKKLRSVKNGAYDKLEKVRFDKTKKKCQQI